MCIYVYLLNKRIFGAAMECLDTCVCKGVHVKVETCVCKGVHVKVYACVCKDVY